MKLFLRKANNATYFERLFARVLTYMSAQNARRCECLIAINTLVRSFAAVHSHMLVQARRLAKTLAAH